MSLENVILKSDLLESEVGIFVYKHIFTRRSLAIIAYVDLLCFITVSWSMMPPSITVASIGVILEFVGTIFFIAFKGFCESCLVHLEGNAITTDKRKRHFCDGIAKDMV